MNRYRRPPPVQEGDITIDRFARDIGTTYDVARNILETEAKNNRLERHARSSPNNRPMVVYRHPVRED